MIIVTTKFLLALSASLVHAALEINPNFPNGNAKSQYQICLEQNVGDGLHISDAFGKCKSLLPENISNVKSGKRQGKLAQVDDKFPNGLAKSAYQICLENAVNSGLHISQAFSKCSPALPDLIGSATMKPSDEWVKMNCAGLTHNQCVSRFNEVPGRPAQTATKTDSPNYPSSPSAK